MAHFSTLMIRRWEDGDEEAGFDIAMDDRYGKFRDNVFEAYNEGVLFAVLSPQKRLGIRTSVPLTAVDIRGDLATRWQTLEVGAVNNDLNVDDYTAFIVTPDEACTISGFDAGTDGKELVIYNASDYSLTILNDSEDSEESNRILTLTGDDLVVDGRAVLKFKYSFIEARWIYCGTSKFTGVTDVTASSPLSSSGGSSPNISIAQSGSGSDGYLSSTDWNTFNNKQNALTFGDLTGTGIGVTGGTGAVIGSGTALSINDEAVTYAKIQNVTDNRLLGRSAGSAGPPMEIIIGSGLSLSGGTLSTSSGDLPIVRHTLYELNANGYGHKKVDIDYRGGSEIVISDTSEPTSPQITYNTSGNMPENDYIMEWFALFTIGGSILGAPSQINVQATLNGSNVGSGSVISVSGESRWSAYCLYQGTEVVDGDVLGLKLWTDSTNSIQIEVGCVLIVPRRYRFIGDHVLYWSTFITDSRDEMLYPIRGGLINVDYNTIKIPTLYLIINDGSGILRYLNTTTRWEIFNGMLFHTHTYPRVFAGSVAYETQGSCFTSTDNQLAYFDDTGFLKYLRISTLE
jgi:hypothetical protein